MPKTQIFENKEQFDAREDKSINGVSHEFAERHPNWAEMNETNLGCWNCTDCIDCNDCNDCHNCHACDNCGSCETCENCKDFYNCYSCSGGKSSSFLMRGKKFTPPKIENIHQKVYEAASQDGALNMGSWHTCETTHCRAGWVVALAGENSKELQAQIGTALAAMVIYRASSDIRVSPNMFYVSNNEALRDMKRCAEEEAKNG